MGQQQEVQLFARQRLRQLYSDEELSHFKRSEAARKFLARKATASKNTANGYQSHIRALSQFVFRTYGGKELDDFVQEMRDGKHNPYDVLADFALWLKAERVGDKKMRANTLALAVKVAKRLLKFSRVPITNEDFKEQVSLPRKEIINKKAADKESIIAVLNAAPDARLKTFLMYEAVYGPRPLENCSLRIRDIDLEREQVTFRAEFSKMRVERVRPMTKELVQQTRVWLAEKYRPYRTTVVRESRHKEWRTPQTHPDDLLFAAYHSNGKVPTPYGLYAGLSYDFRNLLSSIGLDSWEENGRRREFTHYSMRRFVKSTISDLGYSDFSEWWIGHAGSTYYRKTEKERLELFRKLEPYLTFLDASVLNAAAVDTQSKIEEMRKIHEEELQSIREEFTKKLEIMQSAFLAYKMMTGGQVDIGGLTKAAISRGASNARAAA